MDFLTTFHPTKYKLCSNDNKSMEEKFGSITSFKKALKDYAFCGFSCQNRLNIELVDFLLCMCGT